MWTLTTYNALYDYLDPQKRSAAKQALIAAGLSKRVTELETAKTLGTWYDMTKEAFAALSPSEVKRDKLSCGIRK